MPWIVLAALAALIAPHALAAAQADALWVSGTLTDARCQEPLEGLSVTADTLPESLAAVTDAQGRWRLLLPRGASLLRFAAPGFTTETRLVWADDASRRDVNVALQRLDPQDNAITIRGRRPLTLPPARELFAEPNPSPTPTRLEVRAAPVVHAVDRTLTYAVWGVLILSALGVLTLKL